ncbi:GPI biosynthesis protein family Pig-F-domain-containing protein [Amylocystis lapponica]|nr:GPI biosynthesis protein family Pig-F-domain-containing protein [Amylocystis lapponica]
MTHRKPKGAKTESSKPAQSVEDEASPTSFFPFARYTSVVGVHTSLLAFTTLFLPRTSFNFLTNRSISALRPNTLQVLTGNPLRTVLWICAGTLLLQGWWAGWLRIWMLEAKRVTKADKSAAETTKQKFERKQWHDQRIMAFGDAAVTSLTASVMFYVLIILFGAPIASHPLQTYSLAYLLALLTVFTPAFTLGRPSLGLDSESFVVRMTWIRLFAEFSVRGPVDRALVYPAVGAVLGCWSGAIPIGLDWERPWQAWPLTPAFGAMSGYILGSLAALTVSGIKEGLTVDALQRKSRPVQRKQIGTKP